MSADYRRGVADGLREAQEVAQRLCEGQERKLLHKAPRWTQHARVVRRQAYVNAYKAIAAVQRRQAIKAERALAAAGDGLAGTMRALRRLGL